MREVNCCKQYPKHRICISALAECVPGVLTRGCWDWSGIRALLGAFLEDAAPAASSLFFPSVGLHSGVSTYMRRTSVPISSSSSQLCIVELWMADLQVQVMQVCAILSPAAGITDLGFRTARRRHLHTPILYTVHPLFLPSEK